MHATLQFIAYLTIIPNFYGEISSHEDHKNEYYVSIVISTKSGTKYEGNYQCSRSEKCRIDLDGKFIIDLTSKTDSYSISIDYKGEEFYPFGCCYFSNWSSKVTAYNTGKVQNFMVYNITSGNLIYQIPKKLAELDIKFTDK